MKRIIASAGLIALGATGTQAAIDPAFNTEDTKFWSVSATLRGFYDDNYATQPSHVDDGAGGTRKNPAKHDSYGFEISPKAMVHFSNDQSDVGAQYVYSMRYYEDRDNNRADHSHQVDLWLKHKFTPRFGTVVTDSFVIAQEPALIDQNGFVTVAQRANGNNIRNAGAILFNAQFTELLGLTVGYQNNFYDFEDDLSSSEEADFSGGFVAASRSGLLDRIEHFANVDLRWRLQEQTIALVGYQFGWLNYTGDEPIGIITDSDGNSIGVLNSDDRNNRSHYLYVGVEHSFSETWSAALQAGGRYNDYYDSPNDESELSPYAKAATRYTYLPGSYVELGARHDRNATDVVSTDGDDVTVDQESTALWLTVNHRITPKLTGNVLGQFQHSRFNGGSLNNEVDNFFIAGANLTYRFNQYFSAEAGYNFDRLDSDLPSRSFTRNRLYLGMTATY